MKQQLARELLREIDGKSAWYINQWGRQTALEVCRTILNRKSSTKEEIDSALRIRLKLLYEN